jgi:predicted exporter
LRRGAIVALWLAAIAACAWIAARATYTADLTAFLPQSVTPSQSLLMAQLRDGIAARLLLVGLEGADEATLAKTSRALAERLRAADRFAYVANGAGGLARRDRDALLDHRYLLSPGVDAERFSATGLRAALERSLELLASPAGTLVRPTLARDPTGEAATLLATQAGRPQPALREGVWFDPERGRALLTAETRAPGYDLDAQAAIQAEIAAAFLAVRTDPDVRLVLSGPSVFAVRSRDAIERDAWRLSLLASAGVALVLYAAYRRGALVAFGTVPVATGLLAGIAAVALGFDGVHGITVGFGATLIGEAADYSTYLFAQRARSEALAATAARVWPTLRLAVLTTMFGASAMLLSSFTGLAQLGLLTFAGALTAGLVTRYVLPALVPGRWATRAAPAVPAPAALARLARGTRRLAALVPAAAVAAVVALALNHARLWENDLANLNPIPEADKVRDQELRDALGAPDVRHLVVVTGATREAVLQRLERLHPSLEALVARGAMRGFDTPARYLPSVATQRARQAALPEGPELARRLATATAGLPFRDDLFAPFLADVERARTAPPVDLRDLDGTVWGLAARALLVELEGRWAGLAPVAGLSDPGALAASVAALQDPAVSALDLKAESDAMVSAYRDQSLALAGLGVVAIAAVLALGLRRARAVLDVMFPVLAAIGATAAVLVGTGTRLSLLHLVALLLVLGVGTNYSLFFSRFVPDADERLRSTYAVLVATATTLIAFGALATSGTAILQAIGTTVALGAALSLVFAAAWSQPRSPR